MIGAAAVLQLPSSDGPKPAAADKEPAADIAHATTLRAERFSGPLANQLLREFVGGGGENGWAPRCR